MTVKPITPAEAKSLYGANIPDFVFEAFNEVIGKKGSQHCSFMITFDEIVPVILKHGGDLVDRNKIFNENMLDIEPHYQQAGWDVKFIKQPHPERQPHYFMFKTQ